MGETRDDIDIELDFNFEDLEFEDAVEGAEAGTTEEEAAAADAAATEAAAQEEITDPNETPEGGEVEGAAVDPNIDPNEKGDGIEGASPESVEAGSTEGGEEGEETSPQLYQTLAKVLLEKGVLSSVEESSLEEVKDVDKLVELLKKQIEAEEYSDLSETQKTLLKDMREGVTEEVALDFKKSMDQLEAITDDKLESQQVRFDLIYQDFLSKGFTKEKSEKLANRSFEDKEDLADAKEARTNLTKIVTDRYNKKKEADIAVVTSNQEKITKDKDDLKKAILESKEVMGIVVSEKVNKEVYEDMTKIVSTHPDTGKEENSLMKFQRENPIEFSQKLYYLYKITNGFDNIKYLQNKKTTSSVKQLEQALRTSTHVSGGGNPSFADDGESHSLDIGEIILPEGM